MRKLWVVLVLACVLGCVGGETLAAEAKVPVYLNGGKSEITAVAVNGVSYLPLRDLAEVFALEINWDGEQKCVELWCLNSGSRLYVEQRQGQRGWLNEEGQPEWNENLWDMESYEPLLRQGKVWLPISYFENMLNMADISWNPEKRGVYIDGIPMWQQGKWTLSDSGRNVASPVDSLGNVWVTLRRGEPIMGSDYLWRLSPTGEKERICRVWSMSDLKVLGDKCYFLSESMLMAELNDVYQVDCASGEVVQLGRSDFYYNCGVKDIGGLYVMGSLEDVPKGWWVDADGAWAVGIDRGALGDEVVSDKELARESYGLYRLTPGGHELVEKYDLPPKMTEEEQFQQGMLVSTEVYLNGAQTDEYGYRIKRYALEEPYLGIRDMCGLLGCEFSWDESADRLEISDGERRDSIDPKTGRVISVAGGQKREYQVSLEDFGGHRQLPYSFFEGFNGAKLSWDRENNRIDIQLESLEGALKTGVLWVEVCVDGEKLGEHMGLRTGQNGSREPYLNLRSVCEALGCELAFNEETKGLEITAANRRDIIDSGSRKGERIVSGAGGQEQRQEYVADMVEHWDVNYMSWRFFEGVNGAKVSWDEAANRVDIVTK